MEVIVEQKEIFSIEVLKIDIEDSITDLILEIFPRSNHTGVPISWINKDKTELYFLVYTGSDSWIFWKIHEEMISESEMDLITKQTAELLRLEKELDNKLKQ